MFLLDFVQLNNLLAECFFSDLCTTRIYEKSYERQHTQNSLQRFFLSVHFHNIFGLFWAKHCIVWKLTDIDMKYPWREFSILCVYASFYSWIDLDQVYKMWGFWMPNQWFHVWEPKSSWLLSFDNFFFVNWYAPRRKLIYSEFSSFWRFKQIK